MLSTAWVIEQGRAVGFDRVGVAPADDLPALARFPEWLDRGYAGEMDYLRNPKRRDARSLLGASRSRAETLSEARRSRAESKGARSEAHSVICCALNYDTAHPRSTETPPDPECGWVSRYAWGDDYHHVMEEKLEALRKAIAGELCKSESGKDKAKRGTTSPDTGHQPPVTGFRCKLYVDTGPILERVYAARAGLGWQGKNTCLLDSELGSFFFLGLLVTNLALEPTAPQADGCGACTLCLDACPTEALVEPYLLDARRCISYLTIELRGPIPEDLRAPMGRHLFGCDICQDVCPYNRRSLVTELAAFQPRQISSSVPDSPTKLDNQNSKSAEPQPSSPAAPAVGTPAALALRAPSPVQRTEDPKPDPRCTPALSPAKPGEGLHEVPTTSHQLPVTSHQSLFHPSLSWLASLSEDDFKRLFHNSALKRAKHRGLLRNTIVALGNSRNPRFRTILEEFAASDDSLLREHAQWALSQLPTS